MDFQRDIAAGLGATVQLQLRNLATGARAAGAVSTADSLARIGVPSQSEALQPVRDLQASRRGIPAWARWIDHHQLMEDGQARDLSEERRQVQGQCSITR